MGSNLLLNFIEDLGGPGGLGGGRLSRPLTGDLMGERDSERCLISCPPSVALFLLIDRLCLCD